MIEIAEMGQPPENIFDFLLGEFIATDKTRLMEPAGTTIPVCRKAINFYK